MSRCKFFFTGLAIVVLMVYFLYIYSFSVLPGPAFYLLRRIPLPRAGERVLVLSPHPDDETIATGGYIYSACLAGAIVHVILVTDGNKHFLRTRRYQEFRRATALLGVPVAQLRFWEYPDGHLQFYAGSLEKRVRKEIEVFDPAVVLYPHPGDHHPDHAILGRVTERILISSTKGRIQIAAYRYLVHHPCYPHPKILVPRDKLLPPISMVSMDQQWQIFCLSPEAVRIKTAAIREYSTQLRSAYLRSIMLSLIRQNELLGRWIPWKNIPPYSPLMVHFRPGNCAQYISR